MKPNVREARRRATARKAKAEVVGLSANPSAKTITVTIGPVTPVFGEPKKAFLEHEQSAECCFCRRDAQPCMVGSRVMFGAMLATICSDCASHAFLKLHGGVV